MEQTAPLSLFYLSIAQDVRITTTHISLFMALFQLWVSNSYQNPVLIKRGEVMALAKISSSATYHKCLNDLVAYGHIEYIPSYNPHIKSLVYLHQEKAQAEKDVGPAGAHPVKR